MTNVWQCPVKYGTVLMTVTSSGDVRGSTGGHRQRWVDKGENWWSFASRYFPVVTRCGWFLWELCAFLSILVWVDFHSIGCHFICCVQSASKLIPIPRTLCLTVEGKWSTPSVPIYYTHLSILSHMGRNMKNYFRANVTKWISRREFILLTWEK